LPLEGQRLKPIAYKRNYEELIGLFNTDNSGSKDMLTNYENKFIDAYKEKNDAIKDIVDGFSEYLCEDNRDLTTDQIEAKVIKSGKELWNYAVWQHKDHTSTIVTTIKKTGEKIEEVKDIEAIADDRPLYWARIVMQVILKRQYVYVEDIKTLPQKDQDDFFIKSIVPKTSKLYKAIQLFEENSRNYTGIDFSKAGGKKKVLITGFDPFQLNPDTNFNTSMGSNSANTFNPSGILALFLQNNQDLQNKNIQIQTCVFPVRYEDFDNKVVENVIQRHIGQVDLIITTSLNGGNNWFDIEADAIEYRGGFHDNMCIGGQDYKEYNYNSSRFVLNTNKKHNLTTLPKNKIFGSNLSVNINGLDVKFDSSKLNSSTEGGGGNYLSNEIMYRTTAIRGVSSNKPVGHFHLANLDNISRIKEVVDVAVEVIKKIIL
ncbi:hypothetical protein SL053_002359, partial [Flavobacterium psychrophilum]|nr:hypothetical protein [Flavobacterium psychrophilum]